MEDIIGIFLSLSLFGSIGYGAYAIVQLVQAKKERKQIEKQLDELDKRDELRNLLLNVSHMNVLKALEDINFDYGLDLEDGDIYAIAEADDVMAELNKYVDRSPITVDVFKDEILFRMEVFLSSSPLSDDKQAVIRQRVVEALNEDEVDDEFVDDVIDAFSAQIADDIPLLKGKINYTLATLGMFKTIAMETNDSILSEYVELIRIKKGYAD